jgi:hypothetical protein
MAGWPARKAADLQVPSKAIPDKADPAYHRAPANLGMRRGGRCDDGDALVDGFQYEAAVKRMSGGARRRGRCLAPTARWVARRLFLTLASTVFAQRKAGWRAAA